MPWTRKRTRDPNVQVPTIRVARCGIGGFTSDAPSTSAGTDGTTRGPAIQLAVIAERLGVRGKQRPTTRVAIADACDTTFGESATTTGDSGSAAVEARTTRVSLGVMTGGPRTVRGTAVTGVRCPGAIVGSHATTGRETRAIGGFEVRIPAPGSERRFDAHIVRWGDNDEWRSANERSSHHDDDRTLRNERVHIDARTSSVETGASPRRWVVIRGVRHADGTGRRSFRSPSPVFL